nr:methyl-accepting chemotaxis protein [Salinisphaera sp. LB1]
MVVYAISVALAHSLKVRIAQFSGPFSQATSLVLNADRDLYQARVAELSYLNLAPDSKDAQGALSDYRENAQQAYDRMEKFMKTMAGHPGVLASVDGFQQRYDHWKSTSQKIFDLYDKGDRAAAITQLNGVSDQAFQDLRSLYNAGGEAIQAKIKTLQAQTFAQVGREQLLAGIFSLLVAGVATLIAIIGPLMMSRAIRRVTARIKEITDGDGDLTARIAVTRSDEIGDLAGHFNRFIARIDRTLGSVRESTRSVHTTSGEIAQGSHALASRTEQSAANLQETSAAMEQITATVGNTSEAADQGNTLAKSTMEIARRGADAMRDMEKTMAEIGGSASEISAITTLIDDIAFQTNLLALNASVEAARAGEHGRGFAVVAQEVRALASRASNAAGDIRKQIETAVSRSQSGAEIVQTTGSTMNEIVASVERVTEVIGQISDSAREQNQGLGQVNTAVTELDNATQQNAAMVEQTSAAAEQMRDQAAQLNALLASFRLSEGEARGEAAPAGRAAQTTHEAAGIEQFAV